MPLHFWKILYNILNMQESICVCMSINLCLRSSQGLSSYITTRWFHTYINSPRGRGRTSGSLEPVWQPHSRPNRVTEKPREIPQLFRLSQLLLKTIALEHPCCCEMEDLSHRGFVPYEAFGDAWTHFGCQDWWKGAMPLASNGRGQRCG